MRKLGETALVTVGLLFMCEIFKLFKVSYIFGSYCAFFSINNIFSPMVGVLSSSWVGVLFYAFKAIFRFMVFGGSPFLIISLQLSFIFTAIAWHKKNFMAMASILSIILFNLSAMGLAAIGYSLLWLIPATIAFFDKNNKFLTALGATFTGHAIGSVAWVYFGPTLTPAMWLALIPVALYERIIFAIGMVLSYQLYYYSVSLLNKYRRRHLVGSSIL